jgi:hypothetical protein
MPLQHLIKPVKKVLIPKLGKHAHFFPREMLSARRPHRPFRPGAVLPAPTLPIDWYGSLTFPMDGNDEYGDCGEAMAAHGDNTFSGGNGTESTFDANTLIQQYLSVSGGDYGLDEQDVVDGIWKPGVAGNKQAVIYDSLDFDPTNQVLTQSIVQQFYGFCLAFSCPDAWINSFDPAGGDVWDAGRGVSPNPENGHFVFINGVDPQGRYRLQTWGGWVWLTQAGLNLCQPATFAVFGPRQFNPTTGLTPDGVSYSAKAQLWVGAGGGQVPPSPFPAPGPVSPPPAPVSPPPPPPGPPTPPTPATLTTWQLFSAVNEAMLHGIFSGQTEPEIAAAVAAIATGQSTPGAFDPCALWVSAEVDVDAVRLGLAAIGKWFPWAATASTVIQGLETTIKEFCPTAGGKLAYISPLPQADTTA